MRTAEQNYRFHLSNFCYQLGKLTLLREEVGKGEKVSGELLHRELAALALEKEELLKAKEAVGFTDGLSFLEDNSFAGFKMENGILKGDKKLIYTIVRPWMKEYPAGDNYRFEVANLLVGYELAREDSNKKKTLAPRVKPVSKKDRKVRFVERVLDLFVY